MQGIQIYIADDDEDDRMFIREAILEVSPDAEITEAVCGQDLLIKLGNVESPAKLHFILLDMNMPRLNGLEAVVKIKSDPRFQGVPTIMISTSDDVELRQKAYDLGVDSFITKPVSLDGYQKLATGLLDFYLTKNRI